MERVYDSECICGNSLYENEEDVVCSGCGRPPEECPEECPGDGPGEPSTILGLGE